MRIYVECGSSWIMQIDLDRVGSCKFIWLQLDHAFDLDPVGSCKLIWLQLDHANLCRSSRIMQIYVDCGFNWIALIDLDPVGSCKLIWIQLDHAN